MNHAHLPYNIYFQYWIRLFFLHIYKLYIKTQRREGHSITKYLRDVSEAFQEAFHFVACHCKLHRSLRVKRRNNYASNRERIWKKKKKIKVNYVACKKKYFIIAKWWFLKTSLFPETRSWRQSKLSKTMERYTKGFRIDIVQRLKKNFLETNKDASQKFVGLSFRGFPPINNNELKT